MYKLDCFNKVIIIIIFFAGIYVSEISCNMVHENSGWMNGWTFLVLCKQNYILIKRKKKISFNIADFKTFKNNTDYKWTGGKVKIYVQK